MTPDVASKPTVLVVDDTPQNLKLLGALLLPLYRVRATNTGERALRAVHSGAPDLIRLDVMMPGMDGYEVLRRLRADPATRDIPVIFITALDGADNERKGLSEGAVDYITKSVNPAVTLARRLQDHPRFAAALAGARLAMVAQAAPLHDIAGEAFAFLRVAREIAQNHHEKWDGSGYPRGLAGEDIPASARLMALADLFDALMSRRVYKPSMGLEEATRLIAEERGRHFDPDVVDAFLDCREEFAAVARRLTDPPTAAAPFAAPEAARPAGAAQTADGSA